MRKMMLDLFAGFGGQSEAFIRDVEWDVLRIDNNKLLAEVPRMVVMDILDLDGTTLQPADMRIEYVHASPPCHEFSLGFHAPKAIASRKGEDYHPSTEHVQIAKRIIDDLNPRYWSIENVRGSIKHLRPILGEPALIVGPYVYWGRFPPIDVEPEDIPNKSTKDKRHSPLRSNYRALIPYELSNGFKRAMDAQRSLDDLGTAWRF
jgi:hypothetical protein